MGLHKVSYSIGWTAWLDIAPDGVNKATAMERVRHALGIPRAHVVAVGDGRNDIELLQWAGAEGRGVAMGQAPDEVKAAATGRHRAGGRRRSGAACSTRSEQPSASLPCQRFARAALKLFRVRSL